MSSLFGRVFNKILVPIRVAGNKLDEYITKGVDEKPERVFEEHGKAKQLTSMFADPIMIVDDIYLGNAANAASFYKLKDLDVGMIINVTHEISNYYKKHFTYANYPIADNGKEKITEHLIASYNAIMEYKTHFPTKKIFVHCYMGASRSVSVIVFYLMKRHNMTIDEALQTIRNKKTIINISTRFRDDILEAYSRV